MVLKPIKSMFNDKATVNFFWLVLFNFIVWTLLPALIRSNLPLDSVECLAWGHEWQAGYHKHPPLSAWVLEAIFWLSGSKISAVYLASQIFVALALIFTWLLAKEFLPSDLAFKATSLLLVLHFFNYSSPEFNPNVALLPLVTTFNFMAWRCLNHNQAIDWIVLAIVSALGMLTKYSFAFHLIAFASLILLDKSLIRTRLNTIKPYLAAILFLGLIMPHLFWLIKNDFLPFQYIKESSQIAYYPQNHLLIPLQFLITQFLFLVPILLVFGLSFGFKIRLNQGLVKGLVVKKPINKRINYNKNLQKDLIYQPKSIKKFLIIMNFLPLLILIMPSILAAKALKDLWGYAMFGQIGILLFYFFETSDRSKPQNRFWQLNWLFIWLLIAAYAFSNVLKPDKYSLFDGKNAAKTIENAWKQTFDKDKNSFKPLEIIAGDMWIAGDVAIFMGSRPKVFIDLSEKASPWLSFENLKKKGGVLVWNARNSQEKIPTQYQQALFLAGIDSQNIINFGVFQSNEKIKTKLAKSKSTEKSVSDWLKPYNWRRNFEEMKNANSRKILLGYALILPSFEELN